MDGDETLSWIYQQTLKDQDERERLAIEFLKKAVAFCKVDHPEIVLACGWSSKNQAPKLNPKNYLKKLNDNTIPVWIASVVLYMRKVHNIKLHYQDYVHSIGIPVIVKKGIYDDEDAMPLTTPQARAVIGLLKHWKTEVICRTMNDVGFRISEIYNVVESDFDFKADPPTLKVPNYAVKGIKTRGVRYLEKLTVDAIKTLLTGNEDTHPFRLKEKQKLETFETGVRTKLRSQYHKLGLDDKYPDSTRYKYNVHSWRKRCSTEYGRTAGEAQADGYIRHAGNLKQYHLRSIEEREQMFRESCIDLAIDELDKKEAELKIAKKEASRVEILEKKLEILAKQTGVNPDLLNLPDSQQSNELVLLYQKWQVDLASNSLKPLNNPTRRVCVHMCTIKKYYVHM